MSRHLFEDAYRKFWDRLESQAFRCPPLSYDLCGAAKKVNWHMPFINFMVDGELSESINLLNAWGRKLTYLEIWSEVLCDYSECEDDAWSLRLHFVEPLVYYCMLQPSSTRDRLGQVATNAIHQVNLCIVPDYKDVLIQDKLKPGKFLSRAQIETQLGKIGSRWKHGNRLIEALQRLDSGHYREQTFEYRNQASHFIAPRLEVGEVHFVTRDIIPKTRLVQSADGTYHDEEIEGEKFISYGLGGTRPLTLKEVIEFSLSEYQHAVTILEVYSDLLREAFKKMEKPQA